MSTAEIPEEIMREAKDLVKEYFDLRGSRGTNLARSVAAALLARDQRAAEIARSLAVRTHDAAWHADAVADAILTYDKEQS